LVLFSLGEIEMPWDYFLQSVGLQEEEQQVDPQSEEKKDEDNPEMRVSPEPGFSSKATNKLEIRKLHPKRGGLI
jgi:hypothetical protein